jgi:hypothetical protein
MGIDRNPGEVDAHRQVYRARRAPCSRSVAFCGTAAARRGRVGGLDRCRGRCRADPLLPGGAGGAGARQESQRHPDLSARGQGRIRGGEYGEGALRVARGSIGYYNIAGASIGFQIGVQARAEVLLFMTEEAFDQFRSSDGWEIGVDGSVAMVKVGVAGEIDTNTLSEPVIGFVFGEQGLMANLSLEGAKITKLDKS